MRGKELEEQVQLRNQCNDTVLAEELKQSLCTVAHDGSVGLECQQFLCNLEVKFVSF